MVKLVQIFIFGQIVIEPQHITVKAGNEKLLITHSIHADAFQQPLHLLFGGGEFQCFSNQLALVVFSQVGDVGFKQRGHINAAPVP